MRVGVVAFILVLFSAYTVAEDIKRSEEDIRKRVEEVSKTLRCVVCQNQSIYESNAPLAAEMRRIVEERVRAGDTDDEVREYLRGPYGDFILMRPPFQLSTLFLWIGPVLIGSAMLLWFFRKKNRPQSVSIPAEISKVEQEQLNKVLGTKKDEAEL